ncbi:4-hydroxyphenylpyruvate dioxygenase [Coralliovum pocilloporae]|uniref:4-hydroxyphenylpyruvate dioxygenase n=1 Tax=Coralliovum pocilloporae TaxID=3066369 RepID=UPI003306AC85
MGPFPHSSAPAVIDEHNPAGTDGLCFVEFSHPEPEQLEALFRQMGFDPVAQHTSRNVTVWRQGQVNYVLNADDRSFAHEFVTEHGPCAPSMAWSVVDARHAFDRAVSLGAEPYDGARGEKVIDAPAIYGIGGSLLYFIERSDSSTAPFDEFTWLVDPTDRQEGVGLYYLDHLTHNVFRGRMDHWAGWYEKLFNFSEIRFFDIEGKVTGLFSRAMTSPCGRIRIPINESADEHSQIEEYLKRYKGEGIQHIACGSDDIYASVEGLQNRGLKFMPSPPDAYYDKVDERVPGHGEPVDRLKANGILIDGEGVVGGGETKVLLQIFSKTVIGPIFFEFIERKGDDGFGEGNFRALFESIEEDQIRRGVIQAAE